MSDQIIDSKPKTAATVTVHCLCGEVLKADIPHEVVQRLAEIDLGQLQEDLAQRTKDHDECYEELLAAKQHVEINVAEVERLKDSLATNRVELMELHEDNRELVDKLVDFQELLKAAEAIGGPSKWFDPVAPPAIVALHKAIRKVREHYEERPT